MRRDVQHMYQAPSMCMYIARLSVRIMLNGKHGSRYGIDYFWLSPDWPADSVHRCEIVQEIASDHFPVLIEVNCPV